MTFLADENVDQSIVLRLRADGHRVLWVAELEPSIDDEAVLALAGENQAVLITGDKDFGEMVFRQGRAPGGVVLLRLAGLTSPAKSDAVGAAVAIHAGEMAGAFTVISPGQVRIRRVTPTS